MNPSEYIDLGAEVEVQYDPPTHPVNESIICLEPDEEIQFMRYSRIQHNERRLNQPPGYRNFIDLEEEVQQHQPLEAQPTVHRPLNESVICLDDEEIHLVRVVGNPTLPPPFLRRNVIDLTDEEEIRNENTLQPQPGGPILNAGTGQAEIHVLEIQSPRQPSNGNVRARPSTPPPNTAKRPRLSGAEEKENNDATPMCYICYETVADLRRENIAFNITVCKHFFCEPCITAWRRQRASCPICRRRLNKNNIKRYKE